jgi:hypothetical protein
MRASRPITPQWGDLRPGEYEEIFVDVMAGRVTSSRGAAALFKGVVEFLSTPLPPLPFVKPTRLNQRRRRQMARQGNGAGEET